MFFYFDPFNFLNSFFSITIIFSILIVVIVGIIIVFLIKAIRRNMQETRAKSYSTPQSVYRSPSQSMLNPPINQHSPIPQTTPSTAYCRFCGEKTTTDATFCPNCGNKL